MKQKEEISKELVESILEELLNRGFHHTWDEIDRRDKVEIKTQLENIVLDHLKEL